MSRSNAVLRSALIASLIGTLIAAEGRHPFAQIIQGDVTVRVIDGDSLEIGGVRIRLFGVDAPEARQRCTDMNSQPYACGSLATSALEEIVAGGTVTCNAMNTDQYGRTVAICTVRGHDIGEDMVRRGYAVDYSYYSKGAYSAAEREAREAKRGIWAGAFQSPREWRQEHRR